MLYEVGRNQSDYNVRFASQHNNRIEIFEYLKAVVRENVRIVENVQSDEMCLDKMAKDINN